MPRPKPSGQNRTRKGSSGRSSSQRTNKPFGKSSPRRRDDDEKTQGKFSKSPGRKKSDGFEKGPARNRKKDSPRDERPARGTKRGVSSGNFRKSDNPKTARYSGSGFRKKDEGNDQRDDTRRQKGSARYGTNDSPRSERPGRETKRGVSSGKFAKSEKPKTSRYSGTGFRTKDEGSDRRDESRREKGSYSGDTRYKKKDFGEKPRSDRRDRTTGSYIDKTPRKSGFKRDDHEKPLRARPRKTGGGSDQRTNDEAPLQTEKMRLNRYIANSGVCSRREADDLITMGLISVNGTTITELGYKVNPGDEVRYENRVLRAEKPVYILLNKPKGFLTTTRDPQERNTVMHLIGNKVKERIYPVGRLDRNTTGLLLLTNDGDLADKLMHPSYNVKKIYKVELDRPLAKGDLDKIAAGVQLEEGKAMIDDIAVVSEDRRTIGIEIHIGWNRVVRRIFESLDYEVLKLDRSVYAGLDKKDLPRGDWRYLSKEEIVRLKHYR